MSEPTMTTTVTKAPKAKSVSKTSTSANKTTNSTANTAKLASKPAAAGASSKSVAKPVGTVVQGQKAVVLGPQLRKKELVDTIVSNTGMKKKDVKPVVEATLAVLGTALGENRELNLQPFGRLKVRKERELANGRVVVAKVRQTHKPTAEPPAKGPDAKK